MSSNAQPTGFFESQPDSFKTQLVQWLKDTRRTPAVRAAASFDSLDISNEFTVIKELG